MSKITNNTIDIKSAPQTAAGAPVTVGTNPPTGVSIEGAIHLVTDDGTPTGTVLEQYIYDTDSGVWIEMQRNAQDTLKFGTASPTANGEWDGEEFFVTSDGTSAGDVLEQWIWDKQSSTWIQRPAPVAAIETIGFTPVVWNGTAYANAQADTDAKLADLIKLADGTYIHDGKVTWTGHGLTVGSWYYTSQTAAGGYVTPAPTTGIVQQLFFVEDANTIHVDIEEGYSASACGCVLSTTSTVAPSLTDASANAAFANTFVTVGSDVYFVDVNGNAVLIRTGQVTPTTPNKTPVDAIRAALSPTEQAVYDAAPAGSAVPISAASYAALATQLGASKYGSTDTTMNTSMPAGTYPNQNFTTSFQSTSFTGAAFAPNNYLVAFSIRTSNQPGNTHNGIKIKFSDNLNSGFTTHATISGSSGVVGQTRYYFVNKAPTVKTPAAAAKVAFFRPTLPNNNNYGDSIGAIGDPYNSSIAGAAGDVDTGLVTRTANGTYGGVTYLVSNGVGFQALMTPTKAW